MTVEINENKLGKDISHYEIRKRKDSIVVVEIPKGKTIKEIKSQADA